MASPNTLQLRKLADELRPGQQWLIRHEGPSRAERRHPGAGWPLKPGALVPTNRPMLTRAAQVAPQLSRRDRRIAVRDLVSMLRTSMPGSRLAGTRRARAVAGQSATD